MLPAVACLLIGMLAASSAVADRSPENVFEMSLEELAEARVVPAAVTRLSPAEAPASITVITADDIRHTPARNLYDLIEVFVPGAYWANHELGPHLGIRGSIVERNYKFLLRLNGRVLNSKAHYGAKSELEQWDLADVRRIEIVRGPGSVTYGPGAVAGVINILTHDAGSAPGLEVAARWVDEYDSRGVSVRWGRETDEFGIFAFASLTRTEGAEVPQFLVTSDNEAGYIGKQILLDQVPMEYFADFQDEPQVKLHFGLESSKHWKAWLRYTQQGSTWRGNEVKTDFDGRLINQQSLQDRQWVATLEYDRELREAWHLSAMLSADSYDGERRIESVRHPDPEHVLNKQNNFSETEIFARALLNWQINERAEIAFGTEYSWDDYGPGWNDSAKDMRLGENGIIVSGPDSNAIDPNSGGSADRNGTALFAGDGWSTSSFSFFAEANLDWRPWLKVLLSARSDKGTDSDHLFSPRIALILEVQEGHHLKLIAQESQRLTTAGQVYTEAQNGGQPDSESLSALELIYTARRSDGFSFDLSGYWNQAEVIAWNADVNAATPVGDLELWGFEAEGAYRTEKLKLGANYSFLKQVSWKLADGVPRSGISYADYDQPLRGTDAVQQGFGNDLNNWPNQAVKIFGRARLNEQWTLHADARILWDFQGRKDGLTALQRAVEDEEVADQVDAAIAVIESVDAFDYDFRANVSAMYRFSERLEVHLFVQNLLGSNGNKRYAYDSGESRAAPRKVRFVEEPRAWGLRLSYRP